MTDASTKWHPYATAGKCEACKEDKDVVVFGSVLGPFSIAECECCFDADVQPMHLLDATIEVNGKEVADWVLAIRERTVEHLRNVHAHKIDT